MNDLTISDAIRSVGAYDRTLDLFESQYPVPDGISYNSHVILDEKCAVMDTVDARETDAWLNNLRRELAGRAPDYLVVHHMEPDHAANIALLAGLYPEMRVVATAKAHALIGQFFDIELGDRAVAVGEGDALPLGRRALKFLTAPMVHWPEVMVSYEQFEKVLFSADAFGKFGAPDFSDGWVDEARRYYFNIVGKYGAQVAALLKKASSLDIKAICPLHGPVIRENLPFYIGKYDAWSGYRPEDKGVLVAWASMHGHTAFAAKRFAEMLRQRGVESVVEMDLSRAWVSKAVASAFRYDRMAVFAASYDAGLFPSMEDFLLHLKAKAYQKRRVGVVENGSWAPAAGKRMRALLEEMKDVEILEPAVTIRSSMKPETERELERLADRMSN
ncbi:MAG: FprA family A-type flavoprotein [Clostridiales bacterium]|nr:FprA family A-type flavoprotein [Clostridiales bacterium]